MDKWFKVILPDKDPCHNRGRDQMRKKGGGSGIRVPVVFAPNRSYPKRKSQVVPSQRNRDCQSDLAIIIHLKMKKARATKRKTNSNAFIDCRHRNDIRINTTL